MNEFLFLFSIYTYYVFKSTKIVMRLMKILNNQNCIKIFGLYKLSVDVIIRISVSIKRAYPKGNCKNYLQKPGKRLPSRNSKLFCNNKKFRLQKLRLPEPCRQPQQPALAVVMIIQMAVLTRHE